MNLCTFLLWHVLGILCSGISAKLTQRQLVPLESEDVISRSRRSSELSSYFYYQETRYPRDCQEVYEQCDDQSESGIFMIQPDGAPEPFNVHCNNTIDGGGWTVFQRRMDGSVDFYRKWDDYKQGFGFQEREFWLGNDKLAYITNQGNYELRIDMINSQGNPYFAKYGQFRISDETSKYRMVNLGDYLPESTANRDSLSRHRNMSFTTWDRDNDISLSYNCASYYHGAWWYADCYDSNLNGLYFTCRCCGYADIDWNGLPEDRCNIKYTEMKIRRV